MPDYYIDIPYANGLRWVPVDPVYDPRYNTKHFDDFWFSEQILQFEQQVQYYQKVQQNDKIKVYVRSAVGQPQISVYNCEQREVIAPMLMIKQTTSLIGQPYDIYLLELDFATIDGGNPLAEGVYWLYMIAGAGPYAKAISEGIDVKQVHPNTMLFEYTHNENDFDIMFEIPDLVFQCRVDAMIRQTDTDFKRTSSLYDDQVKNRKLISSIPYRAHKIIVGASDGTGVAPWVADKMSFIFSCSSVTGDGKEFALDEGDFEKSVVQGYPKAAYIIPVREGRNEYSKRVFATGSGNTITVMYNIRTQLFGTYNGQPSTLNIQITDAH
jgi:hypothetical protein